MKIKDQKIDNFLQELASSRPTPGGGAVAAISGAMAAALVEMVANITIGKKGYEKVEEEIEILRYKVIRANQKLLELADEDVKAFDQVVSAYRSKDKNKIKKALVYATNVPSKTAKLSREVANLALKISKIGNKNAFSDARSALHLARSAAEAANENIKINKKSLANLK